MPEPLEAGFSMASAEPVYCQFLAFLARDMANHPERLQAVDVYLAEQLQLLVGRVDVDLENPLPTDDAFAI